MWQRIKTFFTGMTVEPVMFLYTMAFGLYCVIVQQMFMEKVCRVNLEMPEEVCSDLKDPDNADIQDEVHKRVSSLMMYTAVLEAVPSAVANLFIGPWSDENGRKVPMVLPFFGHMITAAVLILCTYCEQAPAEYILFYTLYSLCGGGKITIVATTFGYISDRTTGENRTSRLSILTSMSVLGFPMGTFLSRYLYEWGGYYAVYAASGVVAAFGALYTIIIVKEETRSRAEGAISIWKSLSDAFSISRLREVGESIKKPREGYKRGMILVALSLILVHDLRTKSSGLLYTNKKFGWTEKEYTIYNSVDTIHNFARAVVVLPFLSNVLKMHDAMIGMVGAMGWITYYMVVGLATQGWMMYIATLLASIGTLVSTPIYAIVSKCVTSSEQGKLFSVLASLDCCMVIISSVLFSYIYNLTVSTSVETMWFVMAGLTLLLVIGFAVLVVFTFKHEDLCGPLGEENKQLPEEEEDSERQSLLGDRRTQTSYNSGSAAVETP